MVLPWRMQTETGVWISTSPREENQPMRFTSTRHARMDWVSQMPLRFRPRRRVLRAQASLSRWEISASNATNGHRQTQVASANSRALWATFAIMAPLVAWPVLWALHTALQYRRRRAHALRVLQAPSPQISAHCPASRARSGRLSRCRCGHLALLAQLAHLRRTRA